MINVIDYADMISHGMVKVASTEQQESFINPEDKKFAIIVKTASGREIPKFDITTKEAVQNSIYAVTTNDLPIEIKKPAKYYIKQAAAHFGLSVNWETEDSDRVVDLTTIEKKATTELHYRVKINGDTYPLSTPTRLKLAEERLLGSLSRLSASSIQKIACAIIKEGATQEFMPSKEIIEWAHLKIGSNAMKEIDFRKTMMGDNDEYINAIDKIASVMNDMEPSAFIDRLQGLDKIAKFNPADYAKSYLDISRDTTIKSNVDFDELLKTAAISDDKAFLDLVL